MRSNADITLTAERPDGFMVVKVRREHLQGNSHPYFAVGADVYSSRRAFDLGNEGAIHSCGCLHDEVLAAFPDLAPIVALHLANTETGEPMHGPSNGWYRLGGADMLNELASRARIGGHPNYYKAPEPYDEEGYLSPAFAEFFLKMAADSLGVSVEELPNVQDPDLFAEWIETVARKRWQDAADKANAWIDGHANTVEIPAEQTDEGEYAVDLEDGLKVTAKLMDRDGYRDGIGWYHQYEVTVWAGDKRKRYDSVFGGSVADHDEGRVNAREAAFGVLRELLSFTRFDTVSEAMEEYGMEPDDLSSDERERWQCTIDAAERMMDALEANSETIGS
jgi:hypothetical protein